MEWRSMEWRKEHGIEEGAWNGGRSIEWRKEHGMVEYRGGRGVSGVIGERANG